MANAHGKNNHNLWITNAKIFMKKKSSNHIPKTAAARAYTQTRPYQVVAAAAAHKYRTLY